MKKVTLQEIAASLGISRTTVWKVFSGHEGVSDSLKSRIIAKAQELGYEFPENFQFAPLADEQPPVPPPSMKLTSFRLPSPAVPPTE